jgi:hypothetical protein
MGAASSVLRVMDGLAEHDLKRRLALHSVEDIVLVPVVRLGLKR